MSYRELATRPVLTWSLVAIGARSPVSMAPFAIVFLVRERPGGYALGAALAAVYVVGEVVGALALGPRLKAERARPQLAAGFFVGAVAFGALGVFQHGHPVLLGAFAALAGAAPGAAPGGTRALLLSLVPKNAAAQAMSYETMLTYGIWAATPALAAGLALGVNPAAPMLLAAVLMAAGAGGLWGLPAGWQTEADDEGDGDGKGDGKGGGKASTFRALALAWPVYITASAAMGLLALADLVLPALLEQRHHPVGWAGPLLAGYSVAAAAGAFLYGLRSWPGRVRTQSLVLLLGVTGCVALVAVVPALIGIGVALLTAGLFMSGVQVTRTLSLRDALPERLLATGFSLMYAAAAVGYATSATLSGALLAVASPTVAILAGVGLTLLLTLVSVLAEWRRRPATSVAESTSGRGTERAPVDGRRDAESRL
ncbi:MFS transporter [Streptomyces sp. ISL-98]|uniref:MFS transporter n=1 Tax=Streptomyces sp. ISL-98 TaxID=2819192 RepID=UPI001BE944AC|nr:MFS transporter [Streptomyces sp. ISL-98]MBT2505411.1 MFS transporter [Streptomyces sp. ISL-98]